MQYNIIIFEDSSVAIEDLKGIINDLGHNITGIFTNAEQGLPKVKEAYPDLILMDITLSGELDGIEAAKQIKKIFNIPIIYITSKKNDAELFERAKISDPHGYILKPVNKRELDIAINSTISNHKMKLKLQQSNQKLQERVRELNCLYHIAAITEKYSSVNEILQKIVDIVPYGMQFPEISHARLSLVDGTSFNSKNYIETSIKKILNVEIHGKIEGYFQINLERKIVNNKKVDFIDEEDKLIKVISERIGKILERQKIESLFNPQDINYENMSQPYGDLTEYNRTGIILNSISKEILTNIAFDYLIHLETSAAIYETNGDYAMGIFSSGWCKALDNASRKLCNTDDNSKALQSGKWLCHESCWTACSKKSIETGQPMDIKCHGGIHLYAVPIKVDDKIIGSLNFGYGDPPKDLETQKTIAKKFNIPVEELVKLSNTYISRPPFIINIAKQKLQNFAKLIGELVKSKNLELALSEALRKAQKSDQLKSAFLANMSHEIRTPLNAIHGFVDLMIDDEDLDEGYKENLRYVRTSSNILLELISDILDISKIEAGELSLKRSSFSLKQELYNIYSKFDVLIKKNNPNVPIKINYDDSIADTIVGDPIRLEQVLSNLITNAIKFTHKGYIEYGVSLRDSKTLEFYVKDTGIGIARNRLEAIFKPFEQESHNTSQKYGGTGLGLSITKKLIELMGGTIVVESQKGIGSSFNFTLPYEHTDNDTLKQNISTHNIDNKKDGYILIVEDDQMNTILMENFMKNFKLSFDTANCGSDALEKYTSQYNDIDLILMDIRLPDINGIEITKKIRELEKINKRKSIPIIALTALAMPEDIEEGKKAGFDEYIIKPIDKSKLNLLLQKYLK